MLSTLGYQVNGTGKEEVTRAMTEFQIRMNLENTAVRTVALLPMVANPLRNIFKLTNVLPNLGKYFEQKLPIGSFSISSADPSLAVLVKSYMLVQRDMAIVATTACHHDTPYSGKGETDLAENTQIREQKNRRVTCVLWVDKGRKKEDTTGTVSLVYCFSRNWNSALFKSLVAR